MSQKSTDQVTGIAMVLAFVGAALAVAALFLFALAAFVAFIFTIIALIAWNKPLQLGKLTVEPEAARAFVLRGVCGAFLLPVFAAFCSILFEFHIEDQVWPYLVLGGYVAGSIGIEVLMADEDDGASTYVEPQPPAIPPPSPPPAPPPAPFRYASWDDYDEREEG